MVFCLKTSVPAHFRVPEKSEGLANTHKIDLDTTRCIRILEVQLLELPQQLQAVVPELIVPCLNLTVEPVH